MKRIIIFLLLLSATTVLVAQPVRPDLLTTAASRYMEGLNAPGRILAKVPLQLAGAEPAGYLFTFQPSGFLILAADRQLMPVYAYSREGSFDFPEADRRKLISLLTHDLNARLSTVGRITPRYREQVRLQWEELLSGRQVSQLPGLNPFQQWPEPGTTPTEGWLYTNWTQNGPYNLMCPMDLNAGARSVAGCPAIAQAQILNYHEEISGTRFNTDDDYYHNFGAGNSFWIDDDWQTWDFPCFDTLNYWLDSLESVFQAQGDLSNPLKAALCFACGVAAHQVYSASVSGTFGIEQAYMSFQRFSYEEALLVYPDDTTLNKQIAANIKVALPVQLGLLVSGGSGGHNVVVDGYNTDEFYHFNFGWGGPANGWYTLPPQNIPYNLTIIEGAVLDIKSSQYTSLEGNSGNDSRLAIFPNPVGEYLYISGTQQGQMISILDYTGKIAEQKISGGSRMKIHCGSLQPGLYFLRITEGNRMVDVVKLIKE